MSIRRATVNDAEDIASCLFLAMENIVYEFIGEKQATKAKKFLLYLAKKESNQYSYQNCWVAEVENKVIAVANIYDGARLKELRLPVLKYLITEFGNNSIPEDETQAGEYYIDSIGVKPNYRGKGIGSKLLQFLIAEYIPNQKTVLGLLVEEENINAKRLYLKLGFKPVGKKVFMGKKMEHLQLRPAM